MGRPKNPNTPTIKTGKCIICDTIFTQPMNRRRKTCSAECLKEARPKQFARPHDTLYDKAKRERAQYLKSHYEEPRYHMNIS